MSRRLLLLMVIAVSGQIRADEVEDFCNLTNAQAQAKSATLMWPSLNVSFGNPFLVSNLTLAASANQSLTGFIRALLTNDVAYYQCRFFGANKLLKESAKNVENRIFLMQAEAQRPLLVEALQLADANIELERRLFDAQNSTVSDLSDAYSTRDTIQSTLRSLDEKYSALRETPFLDTKLNLREQAAESERYQAKANALTSYLDAFSTWDVVGSGGARYDVQTGLLSGFWSINLTYSFGQLPSTLKASSVDALTRKFMNGQYDSPKNVYSRATRSLKETLLTETNNKKYILDRLSVTQDLLRKAVAGESIRAQRLHRNLAIQELRQKAEAAASTIRVQELSQWVSANAE